MRFYHLFFWWHQFVKKYYRTGWSLGLLCISNTRYSPDWQQEPITEWSMDLFDGDHSGTGDMAWNTGPKRKVTACQQISSQLMACKGKWRLRGSVSSFGTFDLCTFVKRLRTLSVILSTVVRWNFSSLFLRSGFQILRRQGWEMKISIHPAVVQTSYANFCEVFLRLPRRAAKTRRPLAIWGDATAKLKSKTSVC